jgi:glutamate-1-semialdehyde 2,1-aminomutase
MRDHTKLLAELSEEYRRHSPKSAALHERAKACIVDGMSHARRSVTPFPPRPVRAKGAWVEDEDGHRILDFWQGHYANILGHNADVIVSAVARALEDGQGLQTGFEDRAHVEAAEILCRQTGAERVRFTTSGALATMYSILLARAYTGRDLVLKVGGGWHGAQPWGLKGVSFRDATRFAHMETEGFPGIIDESTLVSRFNDPQHLRDVFARYGDRIACFIVEPFIGAGGFIPATPEYLREARALTERYGSVLIFDEVIAGFRFRAGDLGALYGVRPDLAAFGKIVGGGMPVAAVAGRADILALAGSGGGNRVRFTGGTYSAHPASMIAAKTVMEHLVANEATIYPRLAELGAKTRQIMEAAFAEEGILARCTGDPRGAFAGSSLAMLHFPHDDAVEFNSPEDVYDPSKCDVVLRDRVLQTALLLEDVHVVHGLGALSTAHTEADLEFLREACRRVARRIKPHL